MSKQNSNVLINPRIYQTIKRNEFRTRYCKANGFLLSKRTGEQTEDKAKKQFENVDIETDNYAPTCDEMLKRYNYKKFLKRKLFRALYDLPKLIHVSCNDLRILVDDVKAMEKMK